MPFALCQFAPHPPVTHPCSEPDYMESPPAKSRNLGDPQGKVPVNLTLSKRASLTPLRTRCSPFLCSLARSLSLLCPPSVRRWAGCGQRSSQAPRGPALARGLPWPARPGALASLSQVLVPAPPHAGFSPRALGRGLGISAFRPQDDFGVQTRQGQGPQRDPSNLFHFPSSHSVLLGKLLSKNLLFT